MNSVDRARPYVLSLFRIVVAFLFACHGAASLFGVLGGAPGRGTAVPVGVWPYWWAALIEFVGGILLLVGLGSRGTALVCSGTMAYAYFVVHQPRTLFPIQNTGEPAILFCWAFLLLAAFGPGPWALDRLAAARQTRGTIAPTSLDTRRRTMAEEPPECRGIRRVRRKGGSP